MKFGPVPDVAKTERPHDTVMTVGPPPDAEPGLIGSLEAQVSIDPELGVIWRVFLELEPGDLEAINAGNPVEFALCAPRMVPIMAQVWR